MNPAGRLSAGFEGIWRQGHPPEGALKRTPENSVWCAVTVYVAHGHGPCLLALREREAHGQPRPPGIVQTPQIQHIARYGSHYVHQAIGVDVPRRGALDPVAHLGKQPRTSTAACEPSDPVAAGRRDDPERVHRIARTTRRRTRH